MSKFTWNETGSRVSLLQSLPNTALPTPTDHPSLATIEQRRVKIQGAAEAGDQSRAGLFPRTEHSR